MHLRALNDEWSKKFSSTALLFASKSSCHGNALDEAELEKWLTAGLSRLQRVQKWWHMMKQPNKNRALLSF